MKEGIRLLVAGASSDTSSRFDALLDSGLWISYKNMTVLAPYLYTPFRESLNEVRFFP
jgi:hypothetical protein